jgi:hypothetical protein
MDVLFWNLPPDLLDHRRCHAANASWGRVEGSSAAQTAVLQ